MIRIELNNYEEDEELLDLNKGTYMVKVYGKTYYVRKGSPEPMEVRRAGRGKQWVPLNVDEEMVLEDKNIEGDLIRAGSISMTKVNDKWYGHVSASLPYPED